MLLNAIKLPKGLSSESSSIQGSVAPAHGFGEQSETASFELQQIVDSLTQASEVMESQSELHGSSDEFSADFGMNGEILAQQQSTQIDNTAIKHNEMPIGLSLPASMAEQTRGIVNPHSFATQMNASSKLAGQIALTGAEAAAPQTPVLSGSLSTMTLQPVTAPTVLADITPTQNSITEQPSSVVNKPEWAPVRVDTSQGKWGEQMMQVLQDRVTLQAQQNVQEAKIRLDPPDLGKLDLVVRVEGDRLTVQINASSAVTREALMQVSERLRTELQEQNFVHVNVNVGSDQSREQEQPNHQDEEATVFAAREMDSQITNDYSEHWLNTQA